MSNDLTDRIYSHLQAIILANLTVKTKSSDEGKIIINLVFWIRIIILSILPDFDEIQVLHFIFEESVKNLGDGISGGTVEISDVIHRNFFHQ